jgi:SAM-dependent methyltransferase
MEQTSQSPDRSAAEAYDVLAPVYDDFTSHHDYELWLGNLMPALRRHGLQGNRLLDVACGTGKSFLPMLEWGWEVSACDVSTAMVEIAREKVGERAALSVADMRELPAFGEFDLVWCIDDAVNYLLTAAEMEQSLAGMRRNLGAEGLLLFDLNTLLAYRTFFAEEAVIEREGVRMTWRGRTDPEAPPGTLAEASFEAEPLDPVRPAIPPELHRERHFPEAEVLAALERAGLECLGVYGQHQDGIPRQPLDEAQHFKAIYVSRAK